MGLNKKSVLKIFFMGVLLLALIVAWLGFGERGFYHLYRMEQERQVYLEKIQQLEDANQELLKQIDRLRRDKEYIESVARRELNLVKKDEIIYRFSQEQDDKDPDEIRKNQNQ